jgi:hypothetical protein
VHHAHEVEPDLGVEDRRRDRRTAVDDGEHRRSHHVAVAGGPRRLDVEVQRVRLPHGEGVLLDLLAADGVDDRRVALADRLGAYGHRGRC